MMPDNLLYLVVFLVLSVGMSSFIAGMLMLIRSTSNNEVKEMALQTTRLVQKGLAEDVAGLVGNATSLMDTLNRLVQDRKGTSIVLLAFGTVIMLGVVFFVYLVYKVRCS